MPAEDVYKSKAQLFKALAHPARLLIVEKLLEKEQCVNDIRELVKVSQPNMSQHLNILRFSGVVDFRRKGNLRCYFLNDADKIRDILKALE